MKIVDVKAFPTSFPLPQGGPRLGIGQAVKRDAVMVKVTTEDGIVGWGESHHGRAHTAIAKLIETTLRGLILGMDAFDTTGINARIYRYQLASHGMGAACAMAMSGIDMALWDAKGKALNLPLYKLLGGARRAVPAYAGGVALGYQEPAALIDEASPHIEAGYRAVKLRVGDTVKDDIARMEAVRDAFGKDLAILTDANIGYSIQQVRQVMPEMDRLNIGWLEEPFPAHDHHLYAQARGYGATPLAAGENHFTRFEFTRVLEDGVITIWQPDLSKCGGITEALRIAGMASAFKIPIHPHSSMTGVNQAASIHFLAAIENGGYFEADISKANRFRDELGSEPWRIQADGTVLPNSAPGIGVEVDEGFLKANPAIEGPGYV
ncbi:mandelate racemase/muconate lactonizing enzyme family protein [Roseomonas alkaliterrae]|uniref:L-alanine-DL-glutamate epimerase-like enolase superfamily enzyme n=1 Tax=Neoroseomonas alkaliterrae TaxID=1452450 RepID=A0A840XQK0_9PROT|nr:mandelate racemase/muconate lactonizing enzyme family protein [Neoroseomonas alkaliterrae]MBB5689140.1 L-alanine-DL-glutamate epimerase-like enolase superfamily enzyme [Neoroseomonas alkaliterrae]MBR0675389.1 mandelate racemase/muconate lactonizing enzyme family protein [Neoroseomonas alkaliterrae]